MRQRGGAFIAFGALMMFFGGGLIWNDHFIPGFVVAMIGVLALSFGITVCAEPWFDEAVNEEIDRWEENWITDWSPECPVHGKQMCYVRTRKCPMIRDRIDV